MTDPTHPLEWRGTTPVSTRFDDPYFSLEDGLAETEHVFLAGNDLPARFARPLHIAELGFGTGLNLLVTWQAWLRAGASKPLHFTSFEAFPLSADEMARALQAFPTLAPLAARLIAALTKGDAALAPGLTLEIIEGDARQTLPRWSGKADAWYLDGFAPAKNPELWEAPLLAALFDKSAAGASLATYSAAGQIRRDLEAAGFEITRAPGFGRKRHMTRGRKP